MNANEFGDARRRLGLSPEALAAELAVPEAQVRAWAAGQSKVPKQVARLLEWNVAVAEHDEAVRSARPVACSWAREYRAVPEPTDPGELELHREALCEHMRECATCQAEEQRAREPLPWPATPTLVMTPALRTAPTPAELLADARAWLHQLPRWAQSVVVCAAAIGGLALLRSVALLFSQGLTWQVVRMPVLGALAGAYLGGVGAAAFALLRDPLRRLGRVGDYLTGVACALAYLLAIGIPDTVFATNPMLTGALEWAVMSGIAVAFGVVFGHALYQEA